MFVMINDQALSSFNVRRKMLLPQKRKHWTLGLEVTASTYHVQSPGHPGEWDLRPNCQALKF